ncbi:helix-turn-helix domain-containing protein [Pectobacterium brasiliense]|uniref:Helix-turn-helix domain-containing protein n=1 Tax=Pectobacterium brasiliense TaxID=180957 RepID=A0AAW9H0P8_9GAMM|nr:helix-turn-helix domain-containing protein [Pectobacterium brasiliense]MDY4377782.1 helix-turn-helix domain-containing protein [Pectobacterium brasiliense]
MIDEAADGSCETVCPIARSLSLIEGKWTLLIFRELCMGSHRFDEIQTQTGISSHLLSTRIKSLERHGLIERRVYCARPPRYEYFVTPKGKELEGILLLLRSWGTKWLARPGETEPAIILKHKSTGKDVSENLLKLSFDEYDASLSEAFAKERSEKQARFRSNAKSK